MLGIIGIVAVLVVLGLSLLITRIATTALTLTGLSEQAARFQARSAFTGTGFTTEEAEEVVGHPVRRRIIMLLMIVRSAGIVSIILSLILSFAGEADEITHLTRIGWLVGGIAVLWGLSCSKWFAKALERLIERALQRWTDLDVRDYNRLLRLSGEYGVTELHLDEGDWLTGQKLADCKLRDEGVGVLGILREDGSYVGAPHGDTELYPGDTLILYGRSEDLRELDERRAGGSGDRAHEEAVGEEQQRRREQDRQEQHHRRKREQQEHQEREQARQEKAEAAAGGDSG